MAAPSPQLDIESLRTLLAVLDHGGMTPAAKHLELSQSAVSWKIKRLEEKVGKPLLIREGHDFRPTRDGRGLLEDARAMVDIHDRASCRLQGSDLAGKVRVGSNEDVPAEHMASLLGRFKRSHPNASIEFVVEHTEHLIKSVDQGEVDAAILQVDDDGLRPDDVVLWSDALAWVACCETPYATDPVPLVTFGDHCFYRTLSEPLLADHGIDFTVACSVSSTRGVRAAIAAGLGVGVLGSRHLGGDLIEWERGAACAPLPVVHQVARAVPGERPAITAELLSAITLEMQQQPPDAAKADGDSR